MKYIVLAITALLYVMSGVAMAFGTFQFGRAAVRMATHEETTAWPVTRPDDPYAFVSTGMHCWPRYEYQVAGKTYMGPAGCDRDTGDGRIRVLYKRSKPAESILYDIDALIADGILCITFGALLGWRSRSVSIHGRAAPDRSPGAAVWGLVALLGVTAALARDIVETRNDFCGSRRAVLTFSIGKFLHEHERRLPGDWLEAFRKHVDKEGVLSGSPECLAVTEVSELSKACANGFWILSEAEIGASVCELDGSLRYRVGIEFLTDSKNQRVNVRLWESKENDR
jgi:hypothetical protein